MKEELQSFKYYERFMKIIIYIVKLCVIILLLMLNYKIVSRIYGVYDSRIYFDAWKSYSSFFNETICMTNVIENVMPFIERNEFQDVQASKLFNGRRIGYFPNPKISVIEITNKNVIIQFDTWRNYYKADFIFSLLTSNVYLIEKYYYSGWDDKAIIVKTNRPHRIYLEN